MAEFAIAATVAQLVAWSTSTLMASATLTQQLRNAPEYAQRKTLTLRHLMIIVDGVKIDLESHRTGQPDSIPSLECLEEGCQLMHSCLARINDTLTQLSALVPAATDKRRHRSWKAAKLVIIRKDIEEQLHDLDGLVQALQLWHASWNRRLWRIELANIASRHIPIDRAIHDLENPEASTETSPESTLEVAPTLISQERGFQGRGSASKKVSSALNRVPGKAGRGAASPQSRTTSIASRCTCSKMSRSRTQLANSSEDYDGRITTRRPRSRCLAHSDRPPMTTYCLKTTIPWFFGRKYEILIGINAMSGDYRIVQRLRTSRTVGYQSSPGYMAISEAVDVLSRGERGYLLSRLNYHLPADIEYVQWVLENLYMSLRSSLESGSLMANDQDQYGKTALHDLICFVGWDLSQLEVFHSSISRIVLLLMDFGADLNVSYHLRDTARRMMPGTILNSYLTVERTYLQADDSYHFKRWLLDQGAELNPQGIHDAQTGRNARELLLEAPDLATDLDLSKIAAIVVRRDKTTLRSVISNGCSIEGVPGDAFSPLYLAIGWPDGMTMLLDGGADPSSAIHLAILLGNYSLVDMFLKRGADIFFDPGRQHTEHTLREWRLPTMDYEGLRTFQSILEFNEFHSLFGSWYHSEWGKIRGLICTTIARSRQNLQTFGLQKISWSRLAQHGVESPSAGILSEALIQVIIQELRESQVPVPRALWPGQLRSIHHTGWMSVALASELYEAGFQDLNIPDNQGYTPFLLHCSYINSSYERYPAMDIGALATWYLDKGARLVEHPALAGTTYLHVMAHSAMRNGEPEMMQPDGQLRQRLGKEVPDDCQCFCSSSGCLPCNMFYKIQGSLYWDSSFRNVLNQWIPGDYSVAEKRVVLAEICRLQIFRRLGMCHTCCKAPWKRQPLTEDQLEIRSEDRTFAEYLDTWMRIFSKLIEVYAGHVDLFWHVWWDALEKFLPEEPCLGREDYEVFKAKHREWEDASYGSDPPDPAALIFEVKVLMEAAQRWRQDWFEFPDSIIECLSS